MSLISSTSKALLCGLPHTYRHALKARFMVSRTWGSQSIETPVTLDNQNPTQGLVKEGAR